MTTQPNPERQRLNNQRYHAENWRLWGPYLSERAWGTVREDYSPDGNAWGYFDHDQARSRAYRWNEDGLGGISDEAQRLCFGLGLWNGHDAILKERAFGLTGKQGNHGEDVKECYFYLDATPSHAWLHYLYKYPQCAFPYDRLMEENGRRSRRDPPFSLIDSGSFAEGRYWDIEVFYAKASTEELCIQIVATNRGPDESSLWLLPQLWFRNDWSWREKSGEKPLLNAIPPPDGAAWAVAAAHPMLGRYYLYGAQQADRLYTENETNNERLWGLANAAPYVKDAFHRYLVNGERTAVNPQQQGTKFGAVHKLTVAPGQTAAITLVLSALPKSEPFAFHEEILAQRLSEANAFFTSLLPEATAQDHRILRQSLAGMIWNKQFYHYDVSTWLKGDEATPPSSRQYGRNHDWRHLNAKDVISMPDAWEYPWFAAWDLAFHCTVMALIDIDFAKDQVELLLRENYLHPDGQIPACEWAFGDVNPPLHALSALKVFRAERVQRGKGDTAFLKRVLHKLLLTHTWWINRNDVTGMNVFEGGFLGLDNISVYNRSQPLPAGYTLKQADATGWMAMFSLQLTLMALEIAVDDPAYESIAVQSYSQFLAIANTLAGHTGAGVPIWDEADGFFKDIVVQPDGSARRINVFSWVGIIPLFACEVVDARLLAGRPRFNELLWKHKGGMFDGSVICACPVDTNERGEHLLSLVTPAMLVKILARVFDEDEFLSQFGVRSVSKRHATGQDLGHIPGIGNAIIQYVPGESDSALFGGNSNWRGPVWMPTNYLLVQAIEKMHRYLGDAFTFPAPCLNGYEINLKYASTMLAERLADIFRRDETDVIPNFPIDSPHQTDPHWGNLLLFHEYFHGETGQGLGSAHQTGWTGLVANLVMRRYRTEIPEYWRNPEGNTGP
ncbi:MGH1-like glycoside hydrolase domain-containing protein [Nitrosospira sp. Is2]|uniref:MGH1-like glycoside hydrolase domain-containing protein n=1 Tax=Nitrosospira sp. Is2 TaxID=3080532 RepID=UPI002952D641|nr:glucosidase [Nitrosospira sp. Is2]WON72971.1 glucosidase [Nitrosospira sp. Is2]